MNTFLELQEKLSVTKQRKAILEYVLDHLTTTFQPAGGKLPEKTILTDDKQPVSQTALELEIQYLVDGIQEMGQEIAAIQASTLTMAAAPAPAPANPEAVATPSQAPEAPAEVPAAEEKKSKGKKSSKNEPKSGTTEGAPQ